MGKTKILKRITTAVFIFALAVLPAGAFVSAHTHSYVLSNGVKSYYAVNATMHKEMITHYMVCEICGGTEKIEFEGTSQNHQFGAGIYTGVNQHVGTQHRMEYKKTCSLCGFSVKEWGTPYPCPGNGNCIVLNFVPPEEM